MINELRRMAEEKLKSRQDIAEVNISPHEMRGMLYELRVHQIELEMQNEELQRTRNELEISRERYFDLYDLAPVGYVTLSEKGLIQETNITAATFLGEVVGGLLNRSISRFIFKDDQDIFYLFRKELFETGNSQVCELRMVKRDKSSVWARMDANIDREADGNRAFRVVISDISERKKAEMQLKKIEQKQAEEHLENVRHKERESALLSARNYIENVLDSMPSLLVSVDEGDLITLWNIQAEKVTGITKDNAIGKSLKIVLPYLENVMEDVHEAMRTREIMSSVKRVHVIDSMTHYEDLTIFPLVSNGVDGAVIRVDDVTERVKLEQMMMQSEKMISVGGLAAGMAHEINNPLAAVLGYTQNIKKRLFDELDKNSEMARQCDLNLANMREYLELREVPLMLDGIQESGVRAARIVKNMLTFSRKNSIIFHKCNIANLLDKSLELIRSDYDLKKTYDFKKIAIHREYDSNMPLVYCDGNQIQQVFLNLLKNGAEAMFDVEHKTESPRFVLRTAAKNGMAIVEIEDNGPGMSPNIAKRVFEPFFTTKPVGKGTGLGLSVSYFIITEHHGGNIEVFSKIGKGSRFVITLPIMS